MSWLHSYAVHTPCTASISSWRIWSSGSRFQEFKTAFASTRTLNSAVPTNIYHPLDLCIQPTHPNNTQPTLIQDFHHLPSIQSHQSTALQAASKEPAMVAPPATSTSTTTPLPAFIPTNADTNGVIVTVTGAAGYLGEHLVKTFLEAGYTVRGTVRDTNKQGKLDVLKALPGAAERLTFHAADLLVPGSYDSVVEGATYVVHSASPVALEVVANPEETLIRPAVQGTENVLASVEKSTTVKRVVLTGSFRAIFGLGDEHPKGYLYTENDWNVKSSLENNQGYALSKLLAEKAAWAFVERVKPTWDMVVLNPGLIFGPLLSKHHEEAFSIQFFKQLVTGELPPVKLPWAVVDVRDVAKAHVRACQHKSALGRYLITSGTLSLREIIDCVRDKIWRPLLRISVPKPALWVGFYMGMVGKKLSKDDIVHNVGYRILFDSSKARWELMPEGFVEPRETFREMYASLQEHKIIGTFN